MSKHIIQKIDIHILYIKAIHHLIPENPENIKAIHHLIPENPEIQNILEK
jgi:hypothetical protein